MSHSQFHCTGRVYLDLHGLSFETSICYWQDQPGSLPRQTEPIPGKGPAPVCLSTGGSPVGTPPVILVGGGWVFAAGPFTTKAPFSASVLLGPI